MWEPAPCAGLQALTDSNFSGFFREGSLGSSFCTYKYLKNKAPAISQSFRGLSTQSRCMTQVYSTSSNKSSTKKEKNSEKEILDNQEAEISLEEVKKYRGHARNIPAHISDDDSLTDSQKMLYGLLEALSHHPDHFGYCFATNNLLCKITNKEKRTLQRNLEKLHKKGLIIVEISQEVSRQSIRRIWTLEHFAIRERLEKIYGKDKFNQRFYIHVKNVTPPCQKCHPYSNSYILPPLSLDKEVVRGASLPQTTKPPSSAPTTAFSMKKKKDKEAKPQIWLTEEQRVKLIDGWGKIGGEVIKTIDALMKRDDGAYTNKSPYEDAKKFCIERTEKKAKRFRKPVIEKTIENIEKENLEQLDYFLSVHKPPCDVFYADCTTKTASIFHEDINKFEDISFSDPEFKKKLWTWWHGIYQGKSNE